MNTLKWNDIAKGFNTPTMHRTLKVIGWLAKGYSIPMAGRVVAMVSTNAGLPYLALQAKTGDDQSVTLGLDPDIGIIYSFVKEISDEDWDSLLVNVATAEANLRRKK